MTENPSTIGWREWLALPDLGISRIKAKVDTGARSSSIHAFDVEIFRVHGRSRVRFKVAPSKKDEGKTARCDAPLHDMRWIKSSNGTRELRPVIRTRAVLGAERWIIDVTLTSRELMGFRMLLGREAVRRRFVIDPGRSYLTKRPKQSLRKTRRRAKLEDRNSVS
jgi:hypothetical protein